MQQYPISDTDNRVVNIRDHRRFQREPAHVPSPAENLDRFAENEEPDDFRHRMIVNALAFAFVAFLVIGALWLADSLAVMRKNQDCVLSGKRGCSPVEQPVSTR